MQIPVWQINRSALVWLILAYVAVIVIHSPHLPVWILFAAAISIIWRVQRYRGIWPPPNRWIKLTLLAMCLAGLFWEYGKFIGFEPMVALLVTSYTLKLLEMEHKRDAQLVVFLAFFIAAVHALFDQSIANTLYILGCLLLVLAALVGLHQAEGIASPLHPMKKALLLLVQAIPLMLLLFILMPRLGALWSVPIPSHSAKTGVTDSMAPGDYSRLGRSAELAFRVSFEGEIPPQHQLYWRGLVLSEFDGRRWSKLGSDRFRGDHHLQWYGKPSQPWDTLIDRSGEAIHYRVVIEPTRQPWLYSLPTPTPNSPGIALTPDNRLLSSIPITVKKQYAVASWLNYRIEAEQLPTLRRQIELKIPQGYNPRTLELAQQWRNQNADDKALVQQVLGLYNQSFVYTLQPPLLGKHSVDDFLFDTQKGFCEHFASSFVFFMRAAGIPARVVAGYQGGERHPDNYLLVRQYDAHAWAEVWFEGEGWVRVDPTAAVAPERIEANLESALDDDDAFLADSPMSLMQFRHISWLNRLRLELDALNYQWARWVLGYDQLQRGILEKWLGDYSPTRIGITLVVVGSGLLGLFALWILFPRSSRQRDELDRELIKLCRKLEKHGFKRKPGEGLRTLTERVAKQRPELARRLQSINLGYELMRYGNADRKRIAVLRHMIKRLNRDLSVA